MLETRTSPAPSSNLSAGASPRPREAARTLPPAGRGAAARADGRSRLARSEARLLALAVTATALMCAVLVVYLAAYARVQQIGLEQTQALSERHRLTLEHDQLQKQLADLQCPARVARAAQAQGMTQGGVAAKYINASDGAAQTADGRELQVANGGTTADGKSAALNH